VSKFEKHTYYNLSIVRIFNATWMHSCWQIFINIVCEADKGLVQYRAWRYSIFWSVVCMFSRARNQTSVLNIVVGGLNTEQNPAIQNIKCYKIYSIQAGRCSNVKTKMIGDILYHQSFLFCFNVLFYCVTSAMLISATWLGVALFNFCAAACVLGRQFIQLRLRRLRPSLRL
jgi:hypothetical protein